MKLKINILFIAAFLLVSSTVLCQTPEMSWAFGFGSMFDEDIHSVIVDSDDNVIVAGGFNSTIDFDPGPGENLLVSNGGLDMFVAKYDSEANLIWVNHFGGEGEDFARAVQSDEAGNIFVTGLFENEVDFDPGSNVHNVTSNGFRDVFVQKLNPGGDLIWVKSFGDDSNDFGYAAVPDDAGNVYVTGTFQNTVDFDYGAGEDIRTAQDRDIFLLKMNVDGEFQWVYTAGGTAWDNGTAAFVNGNFVYMAGFFRNTVQFNPWGGSVVQSEGNVDSFLTKFDLDGNFQWVKTFGGPEEDYVFFFDDPTGGIAAGGWFKGTCDFDGNAGEELMTSNGGADFIVGRYDLNGNLQWVNHVGGAGNEYGQGVCVDGNGNIFNAGLFSGTPDFDAGPAVHNMSSAGGDDMFIVKYTTNGDFVWSYSTGSTVNDYAYATYASEDGEVYVGGWVGDDLDFDPGIPEIPYEAQGGHDIALFKIETICPENLTTQTIQLCPGASYSIGVSTYTQEGTYEEKLVAMNGCDSMVVTTIVFVQMSMAIDVVGNVVSSNMNGADYQWLDCSDNMAEIDGATEASYIAPDNGSFAVEVSFNGCVDTTNCAQVNSIQIESMEAQKMSIYPTHFSDEVTIYLDEAADLKIYTLSGKLVYDSKLKKGINKINLGRLSSGMYAFLFYNENSHFMRECLKY